MEKPPLADFDLLKARAASFFGATKEPATPTPAKKGPRAASTYRGARRNSFVTVAANRTRFFGWNAWNVANQKAHLDARAAVANGAREAASKALIENNVRHAGLPHDVVVASATLDYYRNSLKRTRPINRIIRALEKQVRGTGRS